jgi:hypothetical protein
LIRKIVFTTVMVVVAAVGAFAGDVFFPTKKGTVLVMASLDAKGKVESYGRTTVKDVKGAGDNLTVVCQIEVLDKKRQPEKNIAPIEYTMQVVNGTVVADINSILKLPVAADVGGAITFSGDTLRIPSKIKPGDKFKDAKMTMTMDIGMMKMVTEIAVTDFKCLAVESVTVPAGTFEAYKITQTVTTTNKMVNVAQKVTAVSWNAFGVGPVKTVVTDENGKVQSTAELHEITK